MKKITLTNSPFTSNLTRALKANKNPLHCRTDADGNIYVCNGHWIVKLSPEEYNYFVRPVTQRDAGNWALYSNGDLSTDCKLIDAEGILIRTASNARHSLSAAPMLFDNPKGGKDKLTGFYSESGCFVAVFDSAYIAMFAGSVEYRSDGEKSGAVVYFGESPVAVVLPVNICDTAISRAVRAWFISDDSQAIQLAEDEINRLRHESEVQAKAIELLRERIAELESELTASRSIVPVEEIRTEQDGETPADDQEPESEQEPSKADELVKKLSVLSNIEVTVKGAQTTAPVVWISGDTKPVKEEIKELGGRWSNKRSAWYIKVA